MWKTKEVDNIIGYNFSKTSGVNIKLSLYKHIVQATIRYMN